MRDDAHPLDRAYGALREATLRRAAARDAIQPSRWPTSPAGRGAKVIGAATAAAGALYALFRELEGVGFFRALRELFR